MPTKKYRVSSEIVMIKVDAICVPEWARKIPREYLRDSVNDRGVIAPIVVARIGKGKETKFVLVDGAGRLEVAKEKGVIEVPARIINVESEDEALLLSIELELTREPWSLEYMYSIIKELVSRGYKKTEIAKMLNVPRSKIYRILKLDEVDEKVREKVLKGEIPLRALDSEEMLRKYLYPEKKEEKISPHVPTGTEEKYIPASELEIYPEETGEREITTHERRIGEEEKREQEEEEEIIVIEEEEKKERRVESIEDKFIHILQKIANAIKEHDDELRFLIQENQQYSRIDKVKKIYNLLIEVLNEITYYVFDVENQ